MSLKEAIARERAARERDNEQYQRHVQTLQAEKERADRLRHAGIKELQSRLGSPVVDELIIALASVVQASDPLTGAPIQDVARVSRPSSERDEGAATRRYHKLQKRVVRKLWRLVNEINNDIGGGPDVTDHRKFAAHTRWHTDRDIVDRECEYC